MKIPFVDLKAQYKNIQKEIDTAIADVIQETAFIQGRFVEKFEKDFAQIYRVKHCISVANGTDAIYIVLKMLGIGIGDEVITVGNSWISTSETISQTGAKPVFVDIEPDYYTINPALIEEKITKKTKAIIPVHLFGQAADIEKIKSICQKYNLFLVEDCAQSHFTSYKNQFVGTFGIAGTFSFFPGKNLGAYGDAGAIITNDDELAIKVRMYARHGALQKHHHQMEGINSRMDGLQASILSVKLRYIHLWNKLRYEKSLYYNERLKLIPQIITPIIRDNTTHTFHVYVIRCEKRQELSKYLNDNGISTAIHYPTPLPFLPAYSYLNHSRDDFPVMASYQEKILSIPMYPEITEEQMDYIIEHINKFYSLKSN